jgi:hypothetical protein
MGFSPVFGQLCERNVEYREGQELTYRNARS